MPLAALKILVPSEISAVDVEKGIIRGCRLAEAGVTAKFADTEGTAQEMDVTGEVIDALLALAEAKGRITAHWTHDRLLKDEQEYDYLSDSVGVWRNFRKDDAGNFIGDVQLAPSDYRDRILWGAVHDPEGIMCSLVFDYVKKDGNVMPVALDSADFVEEGAATTALLSRKAKLNKAKLMLSPEDKAEIATMISDAIKGIVPATDPAAELPATFAAFKTEVEGKLAKIDTIKDEAVTAAMAKFAAQVGTHGKGAALNGGGDKKDDDWDTAIAAQLAAGAPNKATAILRIKRDKPALYNARMASNPNL